MIPILHSSGVIIPGQFGPIKRDFDFSNFLFTCIISSTGTPSVIQTIKSISASIASIIAPAAKGGGTYITLAFASVLSLASLTLLNTGSPKCS